MCSEIISRAFRRRRQAIDVLTKCAIIFAAAMVLAACGLQRDAAKCSSGHTKRAAGRECAPSGLRIRLDAHASGRAAGTEYFTGTSAAACPLRGVQAVWLATGQARRATAH